MLSAHRAGRPRVVRWAGTRAVITTGLAVVAVAMLARSGFTVHSGYPAILVTQSLFALGMGLTIARATASIMGAVPAGRAGVGSAINDTTRQVGGALGVAVMGSVGASLYRHSATRALAGTHLSAAASAKALDSVGSALGFARTLPPDLSRTVGDAARHAFIRGLDIASLVGFGVAVAGGLLAWRFLPAGMTTGAPAIPNASLALGLEPALASLGTEVDL